VCNNWQLTDQEQIALLGLKSLKPRHLYLYRRGDKSFDFDESVANVFDDMVRRSVPGYQSMIEMVGLMVKTYTTNSA
jgi:hypothetical protein